MSESSDAMNVLGYYARKGFSKRKQRDKLRQDLYKQRKNEEGMRLIQEELDSILRPRSIDRFIRYAEVVEEDQVFEQCTNFSQFNVVYEQATCIQDDFENFAISEFVETCEDLEINSLELCQPLDISLVDEDVNVYFIRKEMEDHVETSLLGSLSNKNNLVKRRVVGYSRREIKTRNRYYCDPGDRGFEAFLCRQWGECRLRDSFEDQISRYTPRDFISFEEPSIILQLCVNYLPCTERFRLKMCWPLLHIRPCSNKTDVTYLAIGKIKDKCANPIRRNSLKELAAFAFARKPLMGLNCICQTSLYRLVMLDSSCIVRVRAKFNRYSRRLLRARALFGLKGSEGIPTACFKYKSGSPPARKENLRSLF